MRILAVTDWTPNEGGIEIYVSRLRDGLRAVGDEVRLVTSSVGSAAGGSADYVAFGTDRVLAQVALQVANPLAAACVRTAVREFRPDVVHVNMFEKYLSPAVFLPLSGVPTVAMIHYSKPICPTALKMLPDGSLCTERAGAVCWRSRCVGLSEWMRDLPRYRFLRAGLSRSSSVLACSRWMADQLVASGIEARSIPLPVPAPKPGYRRSPAPEPVFLFCGRLDPEKGVELLLEAFARVRRERPSVRLRIVGDGARRPALEKLAAGLSLAGAVQFLGRLPFSAVEDELARAWALVVPSLWPEPFGLVAVEAIVHSVPVVASASGGLPETVEHGASGLLFERGEVAPLAECLRAVADQSILSSLTIRGEIVRKTTQRHNLFRHVDALREIFSSVSAGATTQGAVRVG